MRVLPLLATALLSASAVAQPMQMPTTPPGAPILARVAAGTYAIEPYHTQVVFALDHLGFSIFRGFLSEASGTLTIDPAKPAAAQLSVTVPIASIHTTSADLDKELVAPDWFDAKQFPTATFVSTKVTPGANGMATVDGTLTLHGVARPVTMRVQFHGAGPDMMSKAPAMGFDGRITLQRSAFGLVKGVPLVSDKVELTIAAAFVRQ